MNSKQRMLIITLTLVNAVVLCTVCVILFTVFNGRGLLAEAPSTLQAAQSRETALAPTTTVAATTTPMATRAPTQTPTAVVPKPTSTLVISDRTQATVQPAVPPVTLQDGWKLYSMTAEGYAIALPPTWEKYDLDSTTVESMLDSLSQKNPQFATTLRGQASKLVAAGMKFFAADLSPTADTTFITNVNVLRQKLPLSVSLDYFVRATLDSLPSTVTVKDHQRVQVAAGEAEVIYAEYALAITGGKKVVTATTQYIVLRGAEAVVITLTTIPSHEKTYAPIFEKIGKSFRWTEGTSTN